MMLRDCNVVGARSREDGRLGVVVYPSMDGPVLRFLRAGWELKGRKETPVEQHRLSVACASAFSSCCPAPSPCSCLLPCYVTSHDRYLFFNSYKVVVPYIKHTKNLVPGMIALLITSAIRKHVVLFFCSRASLALFVFSRETSSFVYMYRRTRILMPCIHP